MLGSLLYLTTSKPNILFRVCLCARFQLNHRESHLTAIKRIFRYLKGTTNLGIIYKKYKDYKLVGFCDAYYAQVKDKALLHCPQQKQNTSQLQVTTTTTLDETSVRRLLDLSEQLED